jgi:hypothetical protein
MSCCVCGKETKYTCGAGWVGRVHIPKDTLVKDKLGNLDCSKFICKDCGGVPHIVNQFANGEDDFHFCPQHMKIIKKAFINHTVKSLKKDPELRDQLIGALVSSQYPHKK